MDLGLAERVYLVTGGSSGLGYATAAALIADGARVVVSGRDPERVAAAVDPWSGRAVGVAADNGDPGSAELLCQRALETFGRLDGALISVGGPPTGTALQTADADWAAAFETVFLGSLRIARAVAAGVGDRTDGEDASIALVLSSSVYAPIPNLAISNGLRPGLAMVSKTLADELGPQRIRVNGLLPGRIATARMAALDGAAPNPAAARAATEASIPLRRYGDPAEFGRVAAFVLSPAASYLTGTMVPVDGGLHRSL